MYFVIKGQGKLKIPSSPLWYIRPQAALAGEILCSAPQGHSEP